MTAHTPGPWTVNRNEPTHVDANGIQIAFSDSIDHYAPSAAEQRANAKLIATAPDLAQALAALLSDLASRGYRLDNSTLDACVAGYAALAKAGL